MLFFAEGFTFRNFLADLFTVLMVVLWFWLLIAVFSDFSGVMTYPIGSKRSGSLREGAWRSEAAS
jgi:hypothetical protein